MPHYVLICIFLHKLIFPLTMGTGDRIKAEEYSTGAKKELSEAELPL